MKSAMSIEICHNCPFGIILPKLCCAGGEGGGSVFSLSKQEKRKERGGKRRPAVFGVHTYQLRR